MTEDASAAAREFARRITRASLDGSEVGMRAIFREMGRATREVHAFVRSDLRMATITFTGEELTFQFTGIDTQAHEVAQSVDVDLFTRLGREAADAILAAAGDDQDQARTLIDSWLSDQPEYEDE